MTIDFNALLDEAAEQQDAGYEIELTATFMGIPEERRFTPRVRRLSINDPSWVETVPQRLRNEINKALTEMEFMQKRARQQGKATPATLEERFKDNPTVIRGADAMCVASFIEPKLYLDRNEEHEPGAVWVGRLHVDDRFDLYMANLDADSEAAKKLRIFRGRAGTAADDRPAGPVAAEPIRHPAYVRDEELDGDISMAVRSNGGAYLDRV